MSKLLQGEKWNVVLDLRDGGDWSLDLCYAGLNANSLKVIDIPFKRKHREWWDVIEGKRVSDWGLERRTLGFGKNHRSFIPFEDEGVWLKSIKQEGIERIWLDERMESFQKYRELGLDQTDASVVVVAGHDRFWNISPEFVASLYGHRLEAMLLDNWYPRYAELPFRARRIGWSCNFDHYWTRPDVAPKKDIDVSFIGYNSHPDRARYVDFIGSSFPHLRTHLVLERNPNSFESFLPKSEYFDVIQRSKISLNLRGAADRGKTMRAYEIPYVGSFMLSQGIDDPGMEEDFPNLVDCVYFRSEAQLERQINWFLGIGSGQSVLCGELHREGIAHIGHQRALGPLSVKNRWGDVIRWLQDDGSLQKTI